MAVNGVSENAAIIPEIWSANWYDELRANLPIANFFDKTPEHIGELRFGDILHMSQFAKATGRPLQMISKTSLLKRLQSLTRL